MFNRWIVIKIAGNSYNDKTEQRVEKMFWTRFWAERWAAERASWGFHSDYVVVDRANGEAVFDTRLETTNTG